MSPGEGTKSRKFMKIIVIDGAQGEGGGQILRTSLSIAMVTGRAVQVDNIRAGRSKPGLLRQHLACIRAAQAISQAEVIGAELGSRAVTFIPGPVRSGQYNFVVGSAGSTTLILQTVLMPLLLADGVSELKFEGGTHNGMAPSVDFIQHSFLPVLARMGVQVDIDLERFGFYPVGGGRWRARIHSLRNAQPLNLLAAGKLLDKTAVATSANINSLVNVRELQQVKKYSDWGTSTLESRSVSAIGPGNILSLRVRFETICAMFESVGVRGVSAERVADQALNMLTRYLRAAVPVDEFLADQLLVPLLLAKGGRFRTVAPSEHFQTNLAVINALTGIRATLTQLADDDWEVIIPPLDS